MNEFSGKCVLVTGGTRGIGAGISRAFLEKGARVIANYARNDQAAQDFKKGLGELGEHLSLKKFDISKGQDVEKAWKELDSHGIEVDILVNNGGLRSDQILASMSESDWDLVLDTNLKGSFLMAQQAVLRMMKKRWGRIINMSSIGGVLGLSGQANYAASKAGQIAMSKSLSKEVGKRGITINNILPGFIETELLSDLPTEMIKEYKKQVPLKRFGQVDEVAHCVLFLASEKAAYITGASLEVTGGL